MRAMLPVYLLVFGGAAVGLYAGVFVVDAQPAVLGWLFGLGAGMMVGAFIAAIATNEALLGRGAMPSRPPGTSRRHYEDADLEDEDLQGDDEEEEPEARR